MGYRGYGERYYEPSRPRPVKDGIKTKSQRGKIGETWWAGRWTEVLGSFDMGARLGRGRTYARRGQVMNLEIQKGMVSARVQGSRPRPYAVTIELKPLSEADWERVTEAMASQAIFAAKLLAGEMPQNIEEAFQDARVSLFPTNSEDLETDCSCPDWANPCKHIAAVYYLLAEEFDRDPFMIFRLRGKEKDELIAALRERRAGVQDAEAGAEAPAAAPEEAETVVPLEECLDRFWSAGDGLASFRIAIGPPRVPEAVLKRLGPPPFGKDGAAVLEALNRAYRSVSEQALRLAYGEDGESNAAG
ncbi:MAG: SWIM zinc finger family protein [Dehalococcoidia bacterium]|nr:SWIM zinc finger family protein [Dehalococcoidia bacterium]